MRLLFDEPLSEKLTGLLRDLFPSSALLRKKRPPVLVLG